MTETLPASSPVTIPPTPAVTRRALRQRNARAVGSGVLTLGAAIAGALLNFVLVVVVGQIYGAAATGVFFTVVGGFMVCANTLKLGADTGLVRTLAQLSALGRRDDLRPTLVIALVPVLIAATVTTGLLWWQIPLVARALDSDHDVSSIVQALVPFVPMLSLLAIVMASTRALGRVTAFALVQNVFLPLSRLIGVGIAGILGWSILAAARMWAIGLPLLLLAGVIILQRSLRREAPGHAIWWPPQGRTDSGELARGFWGFAAPRGVSAVVEIVLEWADVVLVGILAGTTQAGMYAVATRCVKIAQVVDYAARITVSKRLAGALALHQLDVVNHIYRIVAQGMVAVVWPFLLTIMVFSGPAIGLFGSDFADGSRLLVVLGSGMLIASAAGSLQAVLLLGGLSARQLINKLVALTVCIVGNLLVTPHFGAIGATGVWCAAILTDTALAAYAVRHRMHVTASLAPILTVGWRAAAAYLPVALAVQHLIGNTVIGMAVAALAGTIVYAVLVIRSPLLTQLKWVSSSGLPSRDSAAGADAAEDVSTSTE